MDTKLSKNGYTIKKSDFSPKELKQIKDELFVKPFTFNKNQNKDLVFQVYMESLRNFYVEFYGLNKFGKPKINKMVEGEKIDIKFKEDLRPEQVPIENMYLENAREKGGGIISIKCGGGKTVLALHIASRL